MTTSLNNEKHDLHLTNYLNKNIELKVTKQILITKNNVFELKERVLKEKYKELDDINYNVWIIEDKFCNEIWDFSLRHNFNPFFNQYTDITKVNELHECKYNTIIDEDVGKVNKHTEQMLLKLKQEINIINNEIILVRNKNIEKDLTHCKFTLDNLKSFSEEILELIRLISTSENSLNICNTSTNPKPNSCMIEGFMSAKRMLRKSNICNSVLNEKKHIPTSTKIIEESKEYCNMKSNAKFGRFIMKKRSLISVKFEKTVRKSE